MIFDIFIIALFGYSTYLGYKYGINKSFYDFIKVIIILSISAKFSYKFGAFLTKHHILLPDNSASMVLISFLILLGIVYLLVMLVEYLYKTYLKSKISQIIKLFLAIFGLFQAFIFTSFAVFIFVQFKPIKLHVKPYLIHNSKTYKIMDKFCKNVITMRFVNAIIKNQSPSDTKEILYKTLTDKNTYKIFK